MAILPVKTPGKDYNMRRSLLLPLTAAVTSFSLALGVAGGALAYSAPASTASTGVAPAMTRWLNSVAAGDTNGDGAVDAADYAVWRAAHLGSAPAGFVDAADYVAWRTSPLAADANGDGVVDAADYVLWRSS